MSKAERTKAYIIERAAPVFNTKGYSGTSMSDIVQATQLTKGAIYGNFTGKDEVAIEVYKYNFGALRKRIANAMLAETTAQARLKAYTNYYRTNWQQVQERGGCPLLNAAVEADDNVAFMRKNVQASARQWIKDIRTVIQAGIDSGEFRADLDAQQMATSVCMMLEGGMMFFKIMDDRTLLFHALDRIDRMVTQEMMR
ncbi:TetR/AcrR family transcriptional regulator [Nemorincola caseinilytica]|uniref:TetR/AcrR family transcriptional regulator n=1 Tax=Nemorincola caseinilytica TaxID=2054315 RepID=A0ABP8NNX2_9BACT